MKAAFGYFASFLALLTLATNGVLANETIAYTYDALGRLVTVATTGTAASNGQNVSTTFDAAGNRTNYTVTGVGGGGTPTVSINSVSATEGAGASLSFTVSLSAAASGTVTVNYTTQNNSALAGSDYTAIAATQLTFSAGQTSKTVTVSLINDTTSESQETMYVNLTSPSGATLGTAQGTGTINDDDAGGGGGTCTPIIPPTNAYSASSNYSTYTGLSGTGAGMRDSVYNTAASIHGTNAAGNEWVEMNLGSSQTVGTVVVVPASASAPGGWGATYLNGAILQRRLTLNGNWTQVGAAISGAVDGTRTYIAVNATTRYLRLLKPSSWLGVGDFFASASTCSGGGGGGTPTVSIGNASVTEGGSLVFPVTLSATSTSTVTASYASASGTATSGSDFNAASGTVTIPAGTTSGSITVTTIDDTATEAAETMSVTLSAPTNATLGTASGTGTINDNDSTSTANVAIGNASITEGGTLSFTVTRSGVTTSAVSANYATAGGTATSGSDFTAKTGTVSFAANITTATVTVSTIDDATVESAEAMTVTLSSPSSGATITGATGTGTINDNDTAAPTVSIANTANGSEPGTDGTLTVTQSATSGSATTVSLSYSGSATFANDYSAPSSVTIPAGSISAPVTLTILDDASVEGSESATVTLSSVTSGTATIGSPNSATNTIADNDSAPTQIVLTDSGFNVLPAHQSVYYCGIVDLPEYSIFAEYCALSTNNVVVYQSALWQSQQFDPGYTMPSIPVLQVQSNYFGTGVAP